MSMCRIVGAALVLAGLLASPALAQVGPCGPREVIAAQLADDYGESVRVVGLAGQAVFEVWANEARGSWTITRTDARGITCLMAAGITFEALTPEPPEKPSEGA